MSLFTKLAATLGDGYSPNGNSRIAKALAASGPPRSPEFLRIAALPRRVLNLATVPDVSELFSRKNPTCPIPHCPITKEGNRLRPIQSAMLCDAVDANGLFAPVGVGAGKTLASLLLPLAMTSARAVLLIPPNLKAQLLQADVPHLARHFQLPPVIAIEEHTLGTGVGTKADFPPPSGELVVMTYTQLSSQLFAEAFANLKPDLIIADEAHNLRHKDAARTRRFLRYLKENPGCRFVAMSGTLTKKSITDYAHLLDLTLRKNAPIPANYHELQQWAEAVDVDAQGAPGALVLFCDGEEPVRSGFRRRVAETRGVVGTEESALQTSLVITRIRKGEARAPVIPPSVETALEKFEATWTIAGMEIDEPMHAAKIRRRLLMGYFYEWVWPGGVVDHEWMDAKAAWHRVIRTYLRTHNKPGMDAPDFLTKAAERGLWNPPEWKPWAAVRDRPAPPTRTIWIDDYLTRWVAAYVAGIRERRSMTRNPMIIWTSDPPVGDRLRAFHGIPYFGLNSDAELLEAHPSTHPVIACSIQAHGTGKNLQAWNSNLVLFPPPDGATWEQFLGRTHRPGQDADEVTCEVLLNSDPAIAAWDKAIASARYRYETTGNFDKLLYASIV